MVCAIIQARMGSTRLPGKVLMEVDGQPLVDYQIERVKKSEKIDKIIVATSILDQDDKIEEYCLKAGIPCFRGSQDNVLERYFECAEKYGAETVVRLTADCPLIDPAVIDATIELFEKNHADYAANTVPPETSTFPDGMDVEVFSMNALKDAHLNCSDPRDREHVTFHFWKYSNPYKTVQLKNGIDLSGYRMTVDYPEDFTVVEYVIRKLKQGEIPGTMNEIIYIIDKNEEIRKLNSKYYFGIGWK